MRLATILLASCLWACSGAEPLSSAHLGSGEALGRGRTLFAQHCAICHGENGDGRGLRGGNMHPAPANLRSSGVRSRFGSGELRELIANGKPGTAMAGWKTLGDVALDDLTVYVWGLAER